MNVIDQVLAQQQTFIVATLAMSGPWPFPEPVETVLYTVLFFVGGAALAGLGVFLGADRRRHSLGRIMVFACRLAVIVAMILTVLSVEAGLLEIGARPLMGAYIVILLVGELAISVGFTLSSVLAPVRKYLATGKFEIEIGGQNLRVMSPIDSCRDHLTRAKAHGKTYLLASCMLPPLAAIVLFTAAGDSFVLGSVIAAVAFSVSTVIVLLDWVKPLISRMQSDIHKSDPR